MVNAAILLILVVLAYQDWKSRSILWPLVVLLAAVFFWRNFQMFEGQWFLDNSLKSFSFLLVNLLGVTLYFSLKNRKPVNILKSLFGLGDLMLLLTFCLDFSFKSYILFFIGGMLFSIVAHLIVSRLLKLSLDNLPLVTYFTIFYISLFTFQVIFVENFDVVDFHIW